jgi:hypothetical protein
MIRVLYGNEKGIRSTHRQPLKKSEDKASVSARVNAICKLIYIYIVINESSKLMFIA